MIYHPNCQVLIQILEPGHQAPCHQKKPSVADMLTLFFGAGFSSKVCKKPQMLSPNHHQTTELSNALELRLLRKEVLLETRGEVSTQHTCGTWMRCHCLRHLHLRASFSRENLPGNRPNLGGAKLSLALPALLLILRAVPCSLGRSDIHLPKVRLNLLGTWKTGLRASNPPRIHTKNGTLEDVYEAPFIQKALT